MKYLGAFFILITFASCNKNSQSPSDASILMSHTWYPFQVHITTIDSNSVTVTDSTGQMQTQKQVINWDTTFSPSSCASQSTYLFMQNGVLQINDACNSGRTVTASWSITQITKTNFLEFSSTQIFNAGPVIYTLGGIGPITQINGVQFTFNNEQRQMLDFGTTNGPNHSTIYTYDNTILNVFTTYKSF